MIITHLALENFGVFKGRHSFDLRPATNQANPQPVILIGGKNGAGKTTLLEAVRLCLYGKNALRGRNSQAGYQAYIADRIYRSPVNGESSNSANVELTFEYVHTGHKSTYHARRGWQRKGNGITEELMIFKNDKILHDIDRQHWDDFLRDLIPPGVSDLFFFDGEQIQMLADETTETIALETAVEGLLNLDVVGRLKTDLAVYVRQQAQQERSLLLEQIENLRTRLAKAQETATERRQDMAAEMSQLDGVRKKLSDARQALVREGATFILRRDQLETRYKEVEHILEQIRNTIREQANEFLPFALAPYWSEKLRYRLIEEASLEQARLTRDARKTQAEQVAKQVQDVDFQKIAPQVEHGDWERIASKIAALLTSTEEDDGTPLIHPFSSQQRQQMIRWIDGVLNDVPINLNNLGKQLEEFEEEQRTLQQALLQIPSDAVAQPLIDNFQELSRKEGERIERLRHLEDNLAEIEFEVKTLSQQIHKVWEQLTTADSIDRRIELAAKIQVALDQYLTRIRSMKMQELEGQIAEYFNRLCRKPRLVRNVSIDPDHYRVTLFTENGEVLPKSSLSAGERQLYAMALLWALRAASGRLLPIIVDTPMGRLDTDHRHTLFTYFFPEAAHQTIVLSTDSEIDSRTYQEIQPIVSRAYSLEYDLQAGYSHVNAYYLAPEIERLP